MAPPVGNPGPLWVGRDKSTNGMEGLVACMQLHPIFLSSEEIGEEAAAAKRSLPTFPSLGTPTQALISPARPRADEVLTGGAWGMSVARSRLSQPKSAPLAPLATPKSEDRNQAEEAELLKSLDGILANMRALERSLEESQDRADEAGGGEATRDPGGAEATGDTGADVAGEQNPTTENTANP
eukprot:2312395-Pyramimonas_sp.AAC.2